MALQVDQAGLQRKNHRPPVVQVQSLPASFKQRLQVVEVDMFHREWVALQVKARGQAALQARDKARVQVDRVAMFHRVWPVVAPVEVALQVLV